MYRIFKNKRGFTVFFAVLVASLTLAVGVVIYDLLVRSLTLSQIVTQSQYAMYAADTGAECALYWDLKFLSISASDQDSSAFATSSAELASDTGAGQAVVCTKMSNGAQQNIATNGTPPATFDIPPSNWTAWAVQYPTPIDTKNAATTTFYILLGTTASSPCAKVEVGKFGNPSQTTVISHGYNTCQTNATLRVERTLQVNY